LYRPAPVDHRYVGLQKANLGFEEGEIGFLEASTQQARMVFFEIGSAMKPLGTDVHEINIVRHDCCKLVSIVLRPGVAESLRQLANGFRHLSEPVHLESDSPGKAATLDL